MEQNWTTIIKPKNKLMDLKLKEIWQYRDLIMMFVKRDFKTLFGILASQIGYDDEAYKYFSQSATMDLEDMHNNFYAGISVWRNC